MNDIANCKNGRTRLISVDKKIKTVDSVRRETKEKKRFKLILLFSKNK